MNQCVLDKIVTPAMRKKCQDQIGVNSNSISRQDAENKSNNKVLESIIRFVIIRGETVKHNTKWE